MKSTATLVSTAAQVIDHHLLTEVTGGNEAEPSKDGGMVDRFERAAEQWAADHDVINYGVGAATGLALGPLVAHIGEKSWAAVRWGASKLRRLR